MKKRPLQLRFRRKLRESKKQVEDLGVQAEQQIEQHLLHRFGQFNPIRRFILGWVGLLVILLIGLVIQNLNLSGYYQTLRPIPGGIYNEGVLGNFTNANPLYATSDADTTVSHLIFSGLLKYDGQGHLVGDLASSYDTIDHGIVYVVHLRPHLTWQDGQPLTSADVVFTYNLIHNADAQSPLGSSWQGINVTAPDARTVVFTLPGTLASFAYNLTNGIVPEHLLSKVPASDLRSADFNTVKPVGSGPFVWKAIQVDGNGDPKTAQQQIALTPFDSYAGGKPKLQQFNVRIYQDQQQITDAFASGQLTAVEGLSTLPKQFQHKSSVIKHNLKLRAANMVFFKTTSGVLKDVKVRNALVQAADVPSIVAHLSYPTTLVDEPILQGQLGYDPTLAQPKYDLKAARSTLTTDGWTTDKHGISTKNGQSLTFTLTAADKPEDHLVAEQLKRQWAQIGVKLSIDYLDSIDFQNAVNYHTYDAILDGITIGQDPDVFVYWDSSQADIRSANRLNLSEYSNPTADQGLEAGRSRLDPNIRTVKYKPFLQAWRQESPALGLYQPRLLYLTNGTVAGLRDYAINSSTDRLANIQNWEIRQAKVTN